MRNPVLSGEPTSEGRCRVCGERLSESMHCSNCGAAYGEGNRCPHCRSVTDVEPDGALRYRCRVCGGPRVPMQDEAVERSGREIAVLSQAKLANYRRAGWLVAAGVIFGFGAVSLLVALAVLVAATPGIVGTLAMLVAALAPFVVASLALLRSRTHRAERDTALDNAWALVASDVMRHKGSELTAAALAKTLRTDEAHAERLLAQLSVDNFVNARVTEEGDLAYSVPPDKLRIETTNESEELAGEEEERARARAQTDNPQR